MRTLSILTLMLAAACSEPRPHASDVPSAVSNAGDGTLVRFASDSTAFAQNSGYSEPTTAVLRDSLVWATAWATIHANQEPVPALPAVDFQREMVVLVGLGSKGSGGWNVRLESATDSSDGLLVRFEERSPGSGCATTMALTEPVDIARVPKRDGEIRFVAAPVVTTCPP